MAVCQRLIDTLRRRALLPEGPAAVKSKKKRDAVAEPESLQLTEFTVRPLRSNRTPHPSRWLPRRCPPVWVPSR